MNAVRVRELVLQTTGQIVEGGVRADRALARTLRAHRDLTSEERGHVARWTLGMALWRERLRRAAGERRDLQLGFFLVDREQRALAEAAGLAGVEEAALAAVGARLAEPEDPVEALSLRRSLPPWLAARWIAQLGADRADRLAAAMNEPGPIAVRAHALRCDREALQRLLAGEGVVAELSAIAPHALRLRGRPNIVALAAWRGGLFEVQDEASQLVAQAVGARPGELVVDLCAGSGGKTLALAADMGDRGRLVAVDVEPLRLEDLSVRARRAQLGCIERRTGDARHPALLEDLRGRADAVLVDAPCTGLGILRRGPDARFRLSPADLPRFAALQRELLAAAAPLVRPGGRLVYATCSVDPEEDEQVADAFADPRFTRLEARRTWPDVEGCDGFYWAVWKAEPAVDGEDSTGRHAG